MHTHRERHTRTQYSWDGFLPLRLHPGLCAVRHPLVCGAHVWIMRMLRHAGKQQTCSLTHCEAKMHVCMCMYVCVACRSSGVEGRIVNTSSVMHQQPYKEGIRLEGRGCSHSFAVTLLIQWPYQLVCPVIIMIGTYTDHRTTIARVLQTCGIM